ncbi:MAG: HEPN domain-containing protein [Candidatus Heimdallarchaeota archaeon]
MTRSIKSQLAFKRAQRWFQGAQRALEDGRWDDVVYGAQMAVEQAIKAVMLGQGFIFKRVHDVSDEFLQLSTNLALPQWFRDSIPVIVDIHTRLTDQRALAGYGFEEEVGVEYFKPSVKPALADTKKVLDLIERFLKGQLD